MAEKSGGNRRERLRAVDVDNPFYSPDHEESRTNPRRISAVVNIRESTVATLASQGLIDPAQAAAANRFKRLWELSHTVKYASPATERTSGSGGGMSFAEVQANARAELGRASVVLGVHGYRLVSMICGEGYAVRDVTVNRRQRDTAHDMLRIYLDQLSGLWGFATRR